MGASNSMRFALMLGDVVYRIRSQCTGVVKSLNCDITDDEHTDEILN